MPSNRLSDAKVEIWKQIPISYLFASKIKNLGENIAFWRILLSLILMQSY